MLKKINTVKNLIEELQKCDPNCLVNVCRETLDGIIYYDITSIQTVHGERIRKGDGSLRIKFSMDSNTKTCLLNIEEV